jgi:hypothetical protein
MSYLLPVAGALTAIGLLNFTIHPYRVDTADRIGSRRNRFNRARLTATEAIRRNTAAALGGGYKPRFAAQA